MTQDPQAQHVHQRVTLIGFVKIDFPADRRDADAIPVVGNTCNYPAEEPPVTSGISLLRLNRPKPKRVQEKHRTGTHREDISNDSPYPRCSTLEGLYSAGMVVAFHFEGHGPTIPNVDDTRVLFASLDQNLRPGRRKFPEFAFCVLVRAVLAPHHRKNPELCEVRIALQDRSDPLIFFVG